jgi:UDP-glucose 4-epimerase
VETFNLGTGTKFSIRSDQASKSKWTKIAYKIVGRREGDITSAYANTESK